MTALKPVRLPFFTCHFTITGLNLERFMNAVQKENIPLLYVRREDRRTLCCGCYRADLARIRGLAQQKGWRLQNERPAQLAAALGWLARRPGIPVGVALMLALVGVLSGFVWRVEVHGAGPYRAEIAAYLEQSGYVPGTPRAGVDAAALERALTRRYPQIAWFHVYAYHVTLVVDVAAGVPMPQLRQAGEGDVVALRDGIVEQVRVYAGTAAVQPGDAVRRGQVLIRGVERAADEQLAPVRAEGVVTARCWQSHTVEMPLYGVESWETGKEVRADQIVTPWLRLPQEAPGADFLACNTYVEELPVVGCFFPVWIRRYTLREAAMEHAPRPPEQVRAEAADAALARLQNGLYGYEIIDKWVDYCMIEGTTLAATATVEWLMDIGGPAPP